MGASQSVRRSSESDIGDNDYVYLKTLGTGTFGTVHLARDLRDNELYAVKEINKQKLERLHSGSGLVFENEILINIALSDVLTGCDPHIVCFKDLLEDENTYFIVQRYIEGYDINTIVDISIRNNEQLPKMVIKDLMKQLLQGLDTIHSHDYAHRDIKAENIIISPDLQAYYIDFGFACGSVKFNECAGNPGTLLYAPPELLQGISVGDDPVKLLHKAQKQDIWSLGIVFHLLVNKRFPFDTNPNNSIVLRELIMDNDLNIGRYDGSIIDSIIRSMLRHDYEFRPSAKKLLSEVEKI